MAENNMGFTGVKKKNYLLSIGVISPHLIIGFWAHLVLESLGNHPKRPLDFNFMIIKFGSGSIICPNGIIFHQPGPRFP